MIRIVRPAQTPAALEAGAALVTAMHNAVALRPGVAGTRAELFTFANTIYSERTVKQALKDMQHEKCSFCEGKFAAFCYGDVEHYRPKAYSQQRRGGATTRPGYYWLAYTWSNLTVSCEPCNRKRKGNVFPLRDQARRATTSSGIAGEDPLLLDPTGAKDPRAHIRFKANVPDWLTDVGRCSIDLLALDRIELSGARAEHLSRVRMLDKVTKLGGKPDAPQDVRDLADEAAAELDTLCNGAAQFSAMTCDFLDR